MTVWSGYALMVVLSLTHDLLCVLSMDTWTLGGTSVTSLKKKVRSQGSMVVRVVWNTERWFALVLWRDILDHGCVWLLASDSCSCEGGSFSCCRCTCLRTEDTSHHKCIMQGFALAMLPETGVSMI